MCVGDGEMGACFIDGFSSGTVLVWSAVSIGEAKWTRERLHGRLDGRWESGILCLFMVGRAGEGMMVVMVHMFSNSSTWLVSGATYFTKYNRGINFIFLFVLIGPVAFSVVSWRPGPCHKK